MVVTCRAFIFVFLCAACAPSAKGVTEGSDSNAVSEDDNQNSVPDAQVDTQVSPSSTCNDAAVDTGEECDDGNAVAGDGCDTACEAEPGYRCPATGGTCRAARCGDDIVAGEEQCEDGNTATGDGCSTCLLESGWACDNSNVPSVCRKTVCNDGVREGSEPCDDGNSVIGDGCSPLCVVEPNCASGVCNSACGDGLKLASDKAEECDDGNTKDGDGCSADCKVERAHRCTDVVAALSDSFELPVTFRDFINSGNNGGSPHPDFQAFTGYDATEGMVQAALGADGKPVYTGICEVGNATGPCPGGEQTTSEASFKQWYSDATTKFMLPNGEAVEGVSGTSIKFVETITMNRVADSKDYRNQTFDAQLFPLDGRGWAGADLESTYEGHNFSFTSEIRHWFEFKGGETLTFSGDDDVWVFIGGKLALDLGGLHPRRARRIVLSQATGNADCFQPTPNADSYDNISAPCRTPSRELGLVPGNVYEVVLFHAERRTDKSNFDLTLTGFVGARSECMSTCGDGVIQTEEGETCDDGNRDNDDECDRNCQSFLLL